MHKLGRISNPLDLHDYRISAPHAVDGLQGDCFDKAAAESFFATLEKDLLRRRFATRQDARTAVFDYIEGFYNPIRLHSGLGYVSPIQYEKMTKERKAA